MQNQPEKRVRPQNYFYPDLPKGYQISQLDLPIVEHGKLEIVVGGDVKTINVTRAHMEEDAGKSVHEGLNGATGIDLNRAGTPLLEVVSEPEMRSAAEAVAYAKALHSLVTWLDICDGNMAEGSFRIDANVSVRPKGQAEFGTRREIKTSIPSVSWIRRLITKPKRKSRFWKTAAQFSRRRCCSTRKRRNPRDAPERRRARLRLLPRSRFAARHHFRCPNAKAKAEMPELPKEMAARFVADYGVSEYDARLLAPAACRLPILKKPPKRADKASRLPTG